MKYAKNIYKLSKINNKIPREKLFSDLKVDLDSNHQISLLSTRYTKEGSHLELSKN